MSFIIANDVDDALHSNVNIPTASGNLNSFQNPVTSCMTNNMSQLDESEDSKQ